MQKLDDDRIRRECSITYNKFYPKDEKNVNVVLWKKIHAPFCYPPRSFKYHKCKWNAIEKDVYGCLLCGHIHRCSPETCKPYLSVTEDFEICTISGICIRTSQLTQGQEFHDHILHWGPSGKEESSSSFDIDQINEFVHELLLSPQSYNLWQIKISKINIQMCKTIQLDFDPNGSFVMQFQALLASIVQKQNVCFAYNRPMREILANKCSNQIIHTLSLCSKQFKLGTKQNDIRNTVFGLMYLMREGISFANVSVIPKIEHLTYFLPTESTLYKNFKFKPKFITDIENRCKFGFRTGLISSSNVKNLTDTK